MAGLFGHPLLTALTEQQKYEVAFWLCDFYMLQFRCGQPVMLPAPSAMAVWMENQGGGYCFAYSLLASVRWSQYGDGNVAEARALHATALPQIHAAKNARVFGDVWCDATEASIIEQLTQPGAYYPEAEAISLLAWSQDVAVLLFDMVDYAPMSLIAEQHHQFPLASLFAKMQMGTVHLLDSTGSKQAIILRVQQNHFIPVVLQSSAAARPLCPASVFVALELGYINIGDAMAYVPSPEIRHSTSVPNAPPASSLQLSAQLATAAITVQQPGQQAMPVLCQPGSSHSTAGHSTGTFNKRLTCPTLSCLQQT